MSLAFVTDSTADIPADLAEDLHIQVIPNILYFNERSYLDGQGMSRSDFYRELPACFPPPTTAAPSIGVFKQVYEHLCRQGIHTILSIHPSSKFSSLYSTACLAAEEVAGAFHCSIQVIDSNQVTLAMGFQVIAAVEAARRGRPLDEILKWFAEVKDRAHLFALLDTLEYVRRSGRVHWATAALGNMLRLKTLIEVKDGLVHRIGMAKSRSQGVAELIRKLKNIGPLDYLAILHTTIHDPAEIQEILNNAPSSAHPPLVVPVTTIIGTHVGPDGLGFAAIELV